jgi:hypothetical protein
LNKAEAKLLLDAARKANPFKGGCYVVYQEVADALSALPDTPTKNPDFFLSDVKYRGREVFIYTKQGGLVHYGKKLPQIDNPNHPGKP